ncbi:hypothetical protein Gotur_011330 [Gossypium turneri]
MQTTHNRIFFSLASFLKNVEIMSYVDTNANCGQ